MILVNGGLVILPHVCDDLGSVQSGHAGELLADICLYVVLGKTGNLGAKEGKNSTLLHIL